MGATMERLGFSNIGFVYLLLLFIPNLLWWRFRKADAIDQAVRENRLLLFCERVGQVSTTTCALVLWDLAPDASAGIGWLGASVLAMALYEFAWARFFFG